MNGHEDCVVALLASGADCHARDKVLRTLVSVFPYAPGLQRKVTDSFSNLRGMRPRLACLRKSSADSTSGPASLHQNDWTPLHLAAREGQLAAIAALLKGGADKDARELVSRPSKSGRQRHMRHA